ncbi:RGS domain-containing protein [Plasmodiophora brassicae]
MGSDDDQGALLWPLIGTILVVNPVLMAAYYKRRHLQPIAARLPLTTVIVFLALTIGASASAAGQIGGVLPCWLIGFVSSLAGSVGTIGYALRCGVLGWQCRIARAKLARSAAPAGDLDRRRSVVSPVPMGADIAKAPITRRDQWLLDHQWIVTKAFFVPFWVAVSIPALALATATAVSYPAAYDQCQNTNDLVNLCTDVWFASWDVLVVYFSLRLVVCVDGFFIRRELMLIAAMTLVLVGLWLVPAQTTFPIALVGYCVVVLLDVLICFLMPTVLSYTTFNSRAADDLLPITLDAFLDRHDPALVEAFAEFLCLEFSVENLQFLLAVRRYARRFASSRRRTTWMATASPPRLSLDTWTTSDDVAGIQPTSSANDDALSIYSTFVAAGAPLEVNISGDIRDAITKQVLLEATPGGGGGDVFDDAARQIRSMLEFGAFHRFLHSEAGRHALQTG